MRELACWFLVFQYFRCWFFMVVEIVLLFCAQRLVMSRILVTSSLARIVACQHGGLGPATPLILACVYQPEEEIAAATMTTGEWHKFILSEAEGII